MRQPEKNEGFIEQDEAFNSSRVIPGTIRPQLINHYPDRR